MERFRGGGAVAVSLAVGLVVVAAAAAEEAQRPVAPQRIPALTAEVRVDGVLDEPAWGSAWSVELPVEVDPGENSPAPVHTVALVFHDATTLYVGFRADDPDPAAIRAHLSDRDDAWSDDWVGVVLDTFHDQHRDYLFAVNPLGVQMDTIEMWPGGSTPWDGIWDAAARRTDHGWSAELAIPFATLSFQRSRGPQVWGFDAIRGWPRDRTRQMGAFPRSRSDNCYLCQAIAIAGFEGVEPGRDLELVPTLTGARTERRTELPDGELDGADPQLDLGLTATWGLTPNMVLAGTLNPDFSQVEADARQLDVNRRFALFYDEKRPFFMEGADFFDTPLDAVYTRVVRDPSWGVKLTGKEGDHTVATFVARDEVTNLLLPSSRSSAATSLDQSSLAGVVRYERDLGERSSVGGLVTARSGDAYRNLVLGFDGDLRPTATDQVLFQLLGTRTRYPERVAAGFDQPAGDFDGLALELQYNHEDRFLSWWAEAQDIGREVRADLGFLPRVDVRGGEAGLDLKWIGTDDTWYAWLDLKSKLEHRENHDGELLFDEAAVMFTVAGPLQSHAYLRPALGREGYAGREFGADTLQAHLCLNPTGDSHAWLNLVAGDAVDYAGARPADRLQLNGGLQYRFGRHLQLVADDTWERLDVAEGRLYTANVAQLTAAWQFNPRAFVRAILQHVAYDFASELYADGRDPEHRELYSQLLFSYTLNPRTVLFVGYSDSSLGTSSFQLVRTERTLFAKLGYAWLL